MQLILLLPILAGCALGAVTDAPEKCTNFECPNDAMDGGKYQTADCSSDYCACSYGEPYLHHCMEATPPLFFNEEIGVCDWCYDMCDKCKASCSYCG